MSKYSSHPPMHIRLQHNTNQAIPCSALEDESVHRDQNVEMDPCSEMLARDRIASKGLNIVGWYHRCVNVCAQLFGVVRSLSVCLYLCIYLCIEYM